MDLQARYVRYVIREFPRMGERDLINQLKSYLSGDVKKTFRSNSLFWEFSPLKCQITIEHRYSEEPACTFEVETLLNQVSKALREK